MRSVEALKLGSGLTEDVTQGPLVNAAADAISKGEVLRTGGNAPDHLDGFFFEPTVITQATTDMDVATDETFGPLAAIFSFETEQETVDLANATELGLAR